MVWLRVRLLWTAVPGALILAFTLREIFQDLFHPSEAGALSDYIGRTLFRLFRRWPSALATAGPLALVVVIFCWAILQAVGFALIYQAAFPEQFELVHIAMPEPGHAFVYTLGFSLEVMTTLGLGDVVPKTEWLRLLTTLQALLGLALVTASVSWVVLLYPALGRLRTLARRTTILTFAQQKTGLDVVSGEEVQSLLGDLAVDLIRTRVDFVHFPIIYYFQSTNKRASLAHALPQLMQLAERGSKPQSADHVRLASATLHEALADLADLFADRFVRVDSREPAIVFRAVANDHLAERLKER